MNIKTTGILTAFITILVAGILIGWYFTEGRENACLKRYRFVNAAIVCEYQLVIKKTEYVDTKAEIRAYIESERSLGHVSEVSLYFRDLFAGPVFGINETDDFAPASLLKLPVAMLFFAWEEREPGILARKVRYQAPIVTSVQLIQPDKQIVVGQEYTIEELIRYMLMYSDNGAFNALMAYLEEIGEIDRLLETFHELGIIGAEGSVDDFISVRRYARLLRILYTVSYLNAENSEKVLQWLSDATFDAGIAGGVPESIRVAEKFGEREEGGEMQLHDCGIIYFPQNPYLLCVMTRGDNLDELGAVIQKISEIIYTEVDSRRL